MDTDSDLSAVKRERSGTAPERALYDRSLQRNGSQSEYMGLFC